MSKDTNLFMSQCSLLEKGFQNKNQLRLFDILLNSDFSHEYVINRKTLTLS